MNFGRWIPVAALTAAGLISAFIVASTTGYPMRDFDFRGRFLLVIAVVAMIWSIQFLIYFFDLWRTNVEKPLTTMRTDYRRALPSILSGSVGILLVGTFLYSISTLKMMMTAVVPFWADQSLLAIDRLLIGDVQSVARKIQPAMPALDWFYWSWQAVNLVGITWVLHWQNREGQKLVLAYMLTWGIGMFFAYIGSSAGPLFIGTYDPSLAPQTIQWVSAGLWQNHISQGSMLGSGISAFPSMHVAIAVWFAFVLRTKGLAWIGWSYASAIFICSVLIGWHYILDGIAAAAIAWLGYRLCGHPQQTLEHSPTPGRDLGASVSLSQCLEDGGRYQ